MASPKGVAICPDRRVAFLVAMTGFVIAPPTGVVTEGAEGVRGLPC
jgi:hypothetical protein